MRYILATAQEESAKLSIYKPESQVLVWMMPQEYLKMLGQESISDETPGINRTAIESLKKRLIQGLPLDALWLDIDPSTGIVARQEGRHRALAAKELGIKAIPVLLFAYIRGDGYLDVTEDYHLKTQLQRFNTVSEIIL